MRHSFSFVVFYFIQKSFAPAIPYLSLFFLVFFYIRGAFSDHRIGFTVDELMDLKKPEGCRFFAGETLGEIVHGTVTVAWDLGKEAARIVITQVKT